MSEKPKWEGSAAACGGDGGIVVLAGLTLLVLAVLWAISALSDHRPDLVQKAFEDCTGPDPKPEDRIRCTEIIYGKLN